MAAMLTRLNKCRQKISSKDQLKFDLNTKIYDRRVACVMIKRLVSMILRQYGAETFNQRLLRWHH
jgi:hypothetical protein